MSVSRRFFMIGAGALITSAFVSRAVAHAERTSQPLLITPDRLEGDLFVYGDGRISLGPFRLDDDEPVPTWREYLTRRIGQPIRTMADIVDTDYSDLSGEELDSLMDGYSWEESWEYERSPTAKAYRLLDKLDLGPLRHRPGHTRQQNPLTFIRVLTQATVPMSSSPKILIRRRSIR